LLHVGVERTHLGVEPLDHLGRGGLERVRVVLVVPHREQVLRHGRSPRPGPVRNLRSVAVTTTTNGTTWIDTDHREFSRPPFCRARSRRLPVSRTTERGVAVETGSMEQPTTPTGPDVVLRASRLRKDFGDTRAVDDVSITIHAGERVGIAGPNGAGKTTTLLMLLGAIEPDHGTIDIAGHRLPGGRSDAMTRVGFAAGYLPLPSGLTVTETLELFGRLYGVADPTTRAAEVLDELHIGRLAGQKVESLSSGQGTLVGF